MQPCLRIPHGSGAIPVLTTKVALPVHHQVTHAPFLGHPNHGIINGLISMGVKFSHDLSNNTGGFFIRLIAVVAELIHSKQYPAVNRL